MTDEPFDITWDESDEATGESLVNYAATVIKLQRENERLRTEQDSYRGVVDAARRFAYPRPGDTEGYHRAAIRRELAALTTVESFVKQITRTQMTRGVLTEPEDTESERPDGLS
jgi:hypothetical protein